MRTLTKSTAVFGLLLASINWACGMGDVPPRAGNGAPFQLSTRVVTAPYPGVSYITVDGGVRAAFLAPSVFIVRVSEGIYYITEPTTGRLLGGPVECRGKMENFGFSPSGKFAVLMTSHNGALVVDVKTGRRFTVPGCYLRFSPDENFVTAVQGKDDVRPHVLFDTRTGDFITLISGVKTVVSPYASIMLVGGEITGVGSVDYDDCPCINPVLVDMATGHKIGERLVGRNPQFSPDGKFVLLQQRDPESGAPLTVFYSVDTGVLVKKLAGRVESFVGENLAVLLGSAGSSATLPTADSRS